MDILQLFGYQDMPHKQVNDPFKKECISGITILYSKGFGTYFPDSFTGYVEFKCGNTSGEQKMEGTNLVDVLEKVAEFCQTL